MMQARKPSRFYMNLVIHDRQDLNRMVWSLVTEPILNQQGEICQDKVREFFAGVPAFIMDALAKEYWENQLWSENQRHENAVKGITTSKDEKLRAEYVRNHERVKEISEKLGINMRHRGPGEVAPGLDRS